MHSSENNGMIEKTERGYILSMKDFIIMADVNADVEPDYIEQESIVILPQYYHFNDGVIYGDEKKLDSPTFYKRLLNGERAYSMGCNPERLQELFEEQLKNDLDILVVMCSSECSGSYSTACLVAAELMHTYEKSRIYVVDTLNECAGSGLMVHLAQEMKKEGYPLDAIYNELEQRKHDFDIYFLVDHLDCLVKGGRLSAASGMVGSILNIKPILHFEEGKIVPFAKCRGKNNGKRTMLNSLKQMQLDETLLSVVHTDNLAEAERFAKELEEELGIPVLSINEVNLTIGTHTGPDAIGVAFCRKKATEEK